MPNGSRVGDEDDGGASSRQLDPTARTIAALRREIAWLRELLEEKISGLKETTEQKFALVEERRVEQKRDTKDAVDAAFSAAKEAVKEQTTASDRAIEKSEAATSKLLDSLANTFATGESALRREINEVKEQIAGVDRKTSAVVDQKIGAKDDRTGLYAAVAVIATILLAVLALVGFVVAN